jgi:hypothetical protein
MKKEAGLWIDHREAFIVRLFDYSEEITRITSNTEKHVRYSGASEASGLHNDSSEDKRDRRFNDHLSKYYQKVIGALGDVDSVLILGSGEAKLELQKCMEDQPFAARIVDIEPSDKMTASQVVAKVRQHFRR